MQNGFICFFIELFFVSLCFCVLNSALDLYRSYIIFPSFWFANICMISYILETTYMIVLFLQLQCVLITVINVTIKMK